MRACSGPQFSLLFSFTDEALTTVKDALKVKLKSVADVVSAWVAVVVAVVVVDEVVGEVVASVVVVVVGVSSRHEMRHSAPLAVFFLSDTNLNHWIKYQEGQHKALYLKVSLFSAVKFFGPFFWQNLKEEIHNDLSFTLFLLLGLPH